MDDGFRDSDVCGDDGTRVDRASVVILFWYFGREGDILIQLREVYWKVR